MPDKQLYTKLRSRIDILESRISELEWEREKFSSVFKNAPVGIAVVNPTGAIVSANPAFCKMLDYSTDEILTCSIKDLTHPDDMKQETIIIEKMIQDKLPFVRFEKRYLKKNGTSFWAELITSSHWDENKRFKFGLNYRHRICCLFICALTRKNTVRLSPRRSDLICLFISSRNYFHSFAELSMSSVIKLRQIATIQHLATSS